MDAVLYQWQHIVVIYAKLPIVVQQSLSYRQTDSAWQVRLFKGPLTTRELIEACDSNDWPVARVPLN